MMLVLILTAVKNGKEIRKYMVLKKSYVIQKSSKRPFKEKTAN